MRRANLVVLGAMAALIWGCAGSGKSESGEGFELSPRVRSTPMLRSFSSCGELEAALQNSFSEEMRVELLMSGSYARFGGMEDSAAPTAGGDGATNEGGRQEGVDFSGTNNQEAGVDEADFVKTDGFHIYVVNGTRLEILGVPEFGQLTEEGTLELEGRPFQMLLNDAGETPADVADDRLVVFSSIYVWNLPEGHPLRQLVGEPEGEYGWYYRTSTLTKITVVDISDRTNPQITRELFIEGYYQTARRVESTVRMISFGWMDIPGLRYWPELPDQYYDLDYDDPLREILWNQAVLRTIAHNDEILASTPLSDFIPQIYERLADESFAEHTFTTNNCIDFAIPEDGMGHGVSSIMSLDLLDAQFAFDADHIISNWSTVYASQNVLIVAEPSNDWWWYWNNDAFDEATNLHRFDITEAGVTRYTGSGRIDGLLWDQFQLSEHEGNIRVATTTGWWWRWWLDDERPPVENHVFVLAGEGALDVVGHVGGIAIDERIWSCRFVGDKGFLVTFRNIDPLWTVDLSNPSSPQVIGELEVPGVSTYIHPLEDDHLLTIGYGGNDTGLNWRTQLSLFDVTDFTQPALDSTLTFEPLDPSEGWYYAFSEATWEHKAFQYWAPKATLAIPLSTYRDWYDSAASRWRWEYSSRLMLVSVSTSEGLSAYGEIDHSDFFNSDPDRYWDWRDVRRSIFMGDYVYAISDRGVTAHLLSDLTLSASVPLPGSDGSTYWYW